MTAVGLGALVCAGTGARAAPGAQAASGAVPAPVPAAAAPPAVTQPIDIAVVAVADDLGAVRSACHEVYRALATDSRFRTEAHPQMREAMEEPAPPDLPVFQAREALARARAAYATLAFETAVAEARSATGQALAGRPAPEQVALLAEAATLEGVAHHLLGRPDDAQRAFRFGLALDPRRSLDPIVYRPDILAAFGRARDQKPVAGKLVIRSTPGGARVELDGRPVGTTPGPEAPALTLDGLPAGDHLVSVSIPGFWQKVYRRTIQAGLSDEIDVILPRADKPAHVRDVVGELRQAVSAGSPEAEGRLRADLARVLEVDALVVVTGAEGAAGDTDRTASISVYDGHSAASLGDRVLELGRQKPAAISTEIWKMIPARSPSLKEQIVRGPKTPEPAPTPVWRRWWFMTGLGAIIVAGTVGSAVLLSDTNYRAEITPPPQR